MTSLKLTASLVILLGMTVTTALSASIDAVLCIEDTRISSFYIALGDHYRVADDQIILAKKKDIADDELAVVFYVAKRASVAPETVVSLRLDGRTWMEITRHFDLNAEIYYVPIEKASGPPYGRAHGYFKKRKRNQWGSIKLADIDIVNLVNLMFVSEYYQLTADEIARMREQGQSFIAINDKVKKARAARTRKKSDSSQKPSKDKGGKKH